VVKCGVRSDFSSRITGLGVDACLKLSSAVLYHPNESSHSESIAVSGAFLNRQRLWHGAWQQRLSMRPGLKRSCQLRHANFPHASRCFFNKRASSSFYATCSFPASQVMRMDGASEHGPPRAFPSLGFSHSEEGQCQ
jgi:hypothetical protein